MNRRPTTHVSGRGSGGVSSVTCSYVSLSKGKDSDKRVLRQLVGKLSEEKKSLLSEIGHLKDKLDQALAAIKVRNDNKLVFGTRD